MHLFIQKDFNLGFTIEVCLPYWRNIEFRIESISEDWLCGQTCSWESILYQTQTISLTNIRRYV